MDTEEDFSNIEITVTPNEPPEGNTATGGVSGIDLESIAAQLEQGSPVTEQATNFAQNVWNDIKGGVADLPKSVARGTNNAINNTSQLVLGTIGAPAYEDTGWTWRRRSKEENRLQLPDRMIPEASDTVTGGLVEGITQFLVGYAATGPMLRGLGVAAPATTGQMATQAIVRGELAAQAVFDPHDERFSDFIQDTPLANPFNEWLASDEDEVVGEARFKMAVDGLLVAGALEGVLLLGRLAKARKKGNPEEIQEAVAQLEEHVEKNGLTQPSTEEAFREPEQLEMVLEGGTASRNEMQEAGQELPSAPTAPTAPQPQPIERIINIDAEGLRDIVSTNIREQGFGQGRNLTGINWNSISNSDDIGTLMNSLRTVYTEEMDRFAADGTRSWEVTSQNANQALADILDTDPQLLLQKLNSRYNNMLHADADMKMYMDVITSLGDSVYKLSQIVADPLGGTGTYANRAELEMAFATQLELLGHVQSQVKGIRTSFGRAFNSFKIAGENNIQLEGINPEDLFTGNSDRIRELAGRIKLTGGNPRGIARAAREGFVARAIDTVNEVWINSILSGLTTHQVNMWSSVMNVAFTPAEKFLAGATRVHTKAGRDAMEEAAWQYVGYATMLKDAFKLAGRVAKSGEAAADPINQKYEIKNAITSQNYGIDGNKNPALAAVIDGLGTIVRLPTRLLLTEDEFVKQWVSRSAVYGVAAREARERGIDFATHLQHRLDTAIDPKTGRIVDPKILEEARGSTYTNDIKLDRADVWGGGNNGWGFTIQGDLEKHPVGRLIIPFVRTPVNLARYVVDRSPGLALARKKNLNDMMGNNGPEAQAQFMARQATGTLLWWQGLELARSGTITGPGPRDPDARKALEATGWSANAIRIQNEDGTFKYVPISRLGPYADFFTIMANYYEIAGGQGEKELGEASAAMMIATMKLIEEKTFVSGIVRALAALNNPENRGEAFIGNIAGGFVPNVLNQNVKSDMLLREAHGVLDYMRRRTPGFSEDLDPRRTIFGEAQAMPSAFGWGFVSPLFQTEAAAGDAPMSPEWRQNVNPDPRNELARLMVVSETSVTPMNPVFGEIDYREYKSGVTGYTVYDRMVQLTGAIRDPSGYTLQERLAEVIQSDEYLNVLSDGANGESGGRLIMLRKVISNYRELARMHVLQNEEPQLLEAYMQEQWRQQMMRVQQPHRIQR